MVVTWGSISVQHIDPPDTESLLNGWMPVLGKAPIILLYQARLNVAIKSN